MSTSLLETYIRQYIEANEIPKISFIWHGGEPLMQGLNFYRKAIELQQKYSSGKEIENLLQTNGTLLNEEWCKFFSKYNFLIGVSIDGPKDIHDNFRINRSGKPSFERVLKGISLLKQYNVEFNTLCVVSHKSEGRGLEIYQFLKFIGSKYMQFLPAVEHTKICTGERRPVIVPPDNLEAEKAPWSVSAIGYGKFLSDIFDYWVCNDVGNYFVQMFDATLAQYCGIRPGLCTMNETCGDNLIVEHNGDVYPCDHFVYPEYKLGNITENHLKEIFKSSKRFEFGMKKKSSLPQECLICSYFPLCAGECPKHRFEHTSQGNGMKNSLCDGFRQYFEHTGPYMEYMRDLLNMGKSPAHVMQWARNLL